MKKLFRGKLATLLITSIALPTAALGQDEHAAVGRAALDYVEAIEQGKPELMERSVHPQLHKFGFLRESPEAAYQIYPMTFDELVELAATFNKDGRVPADARHSVEILDVLDQTASVKLTAFWGIDYLHLAQYDGEWKIVQVLWQSHPPH